MDYYTIRVTDELRKILMIEGKKGETYSDIILRLIKERGEKNDKGKGDIVLA